MVNAEERERGAGNEDPELVEGAVGGIERAVGGEWGA